MGRILDAVADPDRVILTSRPACRGPAQTDPDTSTHRRRSVRARSTRRWWRVGAAIPVAPCAVSATAGRMFRSDRNESQEVRGSPQRALSAAIRVRLGYVRPAVEAGRLAPSEASASQRCTQLRPGPQRRVYRCHREAGHPAQDSTRKLNDSVWDPSLQYVGGLCSCLRSRLLHVRRILAAQRAHDNDAPVMQPAYAQRFAAMSIARDRRLAIETRPDAVRALTAAPTRGRCYRRPWPVATQNWRPAWRQTTGSRQATRSLTLPY